MMTNLNYANNSNTEKADEITAVTNSQQSARRSDRAFCFICQRAVKLLSFSETAELFSTNVEGILRLTSKIELHLLHNRKGLVMICRDAVRAILNQREMMISYPRIIMINPINQGEER